MKKTDKRNEGNIRDEKSFVSFFMEYSKIKNVYKM